MKAYQVHEGSENKHGFQEYELKATYLSKDRALEYAQKIIAKTHLDNGDILHEDDWSKDGKYKSWTLQGWGFVDICKIVQIEIIE